jgi:hypothetical protein
MPAVALRASVSGLDDAPAASPVPALPISNVNAQLRPSREHNAPPPAHHAVCLSPTRPADRMRVQAPFLLDRALAVANCGSVAGRTSSDGRSPRKQRVRLAAPFLVRSLTVG